MRSSISLLFVLLLVAACGDDDAVGDSGVADSGGGGRDGGGPGTDGGAPTSDGGAGDDCDPEHATCDIVPPTCPPGFTPVIEGGCYGPCISNIECAPIPCDPTGAPSECPRGWGCVSSGQCAPPR